MSKKEKIKGLFREKDLKEVKHYSKKVSITVLIAVAVLLIALTVIGIMFIQYEFEDTDSFSSLVKENYFLSAILLIVICIVQVMVALIPSEVVEIAAGYAFGPWLGALYCLIGITIGSIIVISLTRKFGRGFVESLYPREKIDALPILRSPSKLNTLVALLFFIPGTPKDLITYVIGLTKMKIGGYLLLTTFSRLPAILISTVSGGALGENKLTQALIFFIISVLTGIIGYFVYLAISKQHSKDNSADTLHK